MLLIFFCVKRLVLALSHVLCLVHDYTAVNCTILRRRLKNENVFNDEACFKRTGSSR